jgi:L-arabinokinase
MGDITPFAFDVACKAGIPSIALSNFTWYDIYREYLADGDGFKPYLDEIAAQYNRADLFLSMFPANPMEYIKKKKDISLIGRSGKPVREQISRRYGFESKKKIALIYIGCYGLDNVSWERLGPLSDWEFLSLYDVMNRPSNFHVVNKQWLRYEDLMASADIVISKPGYGVVSECFLNGIPLLYIPRTNFAEYPVLKAAIDSWSGGYQINECELSSCEWIDRLNFIAEREKPHPVETDGVEMCVQEILRFM